MVYCASKLRKLKVISYSADDLQGFLVFPQHPGWVFTLVNP